MKDIRKLIDEHHRKISKGKEIFQKLNGLRHGISTQTWNNGNKRNIINWKYDVRNGISHFFNTIGQRTHIRQFFKNIRHGPRIDFNYK